MNLRPELERRLESRASRWQPVTLATGVLGVACAVGLAFPGEHGFARLQHSWLFATMFFLTISLGALFFVIIQHLVRAGWSVTVRRVAELMAANAWLPALLLVPLIVQTLRGDGSLYPWADPELIADEPLVVAKTGYLNGTFFAVRVAVYATVWILLGRFFLGRSVVQDRTTGAGPTLAMERRAPPSIIAFALTVTFAAFDLLMSLYPAWFSTIFGVYVFAGCAISFFASCALIVRFLQKRGVIGPEVTVEHYHDLGKFLFAFVFFWSYIAFSQYMLIWYADIPEETIFFQRRIHGPWAVVSWLLLFGHFAIPFAGLLSRHTKRRVGFLMFWAVWLLLAHAVDLFWIVVPKVQDHGVLIHGMDVASWFGVGGLWAYFLVRAASSRSLVPTGDPRLPESLAFENL